MPKVPKAPREAPFPKLPKERRKPLAKALRERLSGAPLGIGELAEALEAEPEEVVVAMRELRGKKRGRLLSSLHRGRTVWRWEELPKAEKPGKPAKPTKAAKSTKVASKRK
jgi:hypothetical protein